MDDVIRRKVHAFSGKNVEEMLHHGGYYFGIDLTGDSLHLGHLGPLSFLRSLKKANKKIKVIILLGDATTVVGDPTGRWSARDTVEDGIIKQRIDTISSQLYHLFPQGAIEIVYNSKWLKSLSVIDILKNYGVHISVPKMLKYDHTKERLREDKKGHGFNFAEFAYIVLQGIDFIQLRERHGITCQIGGQDQWVNRLQGLYLGIKLHMHFIYII